MLHLKCRTHTCTHSHTCTRTNTNIYTYTHEHTHTYTHSHTRTHTNTPNYWNILRIMRIKADLRDNVQSSHVDKVFVDRWSMGSSLCKQSIQALIISSNSHTVHGLNCSYRTCSCRAIKDSCGRENIMKYPVLPVYGAVPDTIKTIPKSL